jgi:hypothetical protein
MTIGSAHLPPVTNYAFRLLQSHPTLIHLLSCLLNPHVQVSKILSPERLKLTDRQIHLDLARVNHDDLVSLEKTNRMLMRTSRCAVFGLRGYVLLVVTVKTESS